MSILTWHKHLAGDSRIVAFREDERAGAAWVYCDCTGPWAAWCLLRHLQRLGYPQVARRDWESLWLAPAEPRLTPPASVRSQGSGRQLGWRQPALRRTV